MNKVRALLALLVIHKYEISDDGMVRHRTQILSRTPEEFFKACLRNGWVKEKTGYEVLDKKGDWIESKNTRI